MTNKWIKDLKLDGEYDRIIVRWKAKNSKIAWEKQMLVKN